MKNYLKKTAAFVLAFALAVSMFAFSAFAAEDTAPSAEIYCVAYYDGDGNLDSVRLLTGELADGEADLLARLYKTESAQSAKIISWTKNLEPIEGSGREVDLEDKSSVVVLHTNDMHGSLAASSSIIGSDYTAALKKLEGAILVDGGDAAQGVALASQSKGEDVIKIMNAAGYDVMAAGNHEFDYGIEQLKKLVSLAEFPIISANTYENGNPLFEDEKSDGQNVIIEKNGVKIGFFALTTTDTKTSTKPENLEGITFADEIETAKEQVEELDSEGADVIIALTHMGILETQSCTSRELAEAMEGTELDAIIDGHSHSVVNDKVGDITIAQTGTGGTCVGRMEINVGEDGAVEIGETLLSKAFFNNIAPDEDTTKVINDANGALSETLKAEIGETTTTLWGGQINQISESRSGETNLGDLICDAMIEQAKDLVPESDKDCPIVAVENGGGFRTAIPNGKMTVGSVVNTLPFANTVMIKEITPAVLYSALEGYLSSVTAQDTETGFLTASYSGSFPQIGGMRVQYNPNAEKGAKVVNVYLDEETPLERDDDKTKLILVSNDYVIGSGVFADIPVLAEGGGLTEAVLDYIASVTENGTKPLEMQTTEGRIETVSEYKPKPYTAHITLSGAESVGDGTEIEVFVDGMPQTGVVRERILNIEETGVVRDKVLDIEVTDGAHAVKLYEDQNEVYVNNYSGNGVVTGDFGGLNIVYPTLEYRA